MTRPIVLSNGSLQVGLNLFGMVHDLYYPYVGQENHARAKKMRHRIGIWVDDTFSWLDDGNWDIGMDYAHNAMIGLTKAHHKELRITLEFDDCVDAEHDAFLRNIHIINCIDRPREVRVFMHQVFLISDSLAGDTAQYLPGEPAILHYKGHRAFVMSGRGQNGKDFDQFSVGLYGIEGHEGTYKDAEDGELWGNAVEQGDVDSVMRFVFQLPALESTRMSYWLAAGLTPREAIATHRAIKYETVLRRQEQTFGYWRKWLEPAEKFIEQLPRKQQDPFRKSLLIVKAHIDQHGAIMASTDTTMLNYSRDAYAYCWPRDASYALWPLLRLGYHQELRQFLGFCRTALEPDGFLMHKYQADGALGSSWHPYIYAGKPQPPIQEDETAIVLFLLGQYHQITGKTDLIEEFYMSLVQPMANFLANYIDETSKLPHPSYDLWEERFSTTTYTTAVTYAGLLSAAKMAESNHDEDSAVRWQTTAEDIRNVAQNTLFNAKRKFFFRGFYRDGDQIKFDETIDLASFYGAFMFGLFDVRSEQMRQSFQTLRDTFHMGDEGVTPLPRYEYDRYDSVDPASLGNPWFITTMWTAQYYMEIDELPKAREILDWVQAQMLPSGVLAEQINPYTHGFISVAPLVWSQAEFMNSLLDLASDPSKHPEAHHE